MTHILWSSLIMYPKSFCWLIYLEVLYTIPTKESPAHKNVIQCDFNTSPCFYTYHFQKMFSKFPNLLWKFTRHYLNYFHSFTNLFLTQSGQNHWFVFFLPFFFWLGAYTWHSIIENEPTKPCRSRLERRRHRDVMSCCRSNLFHFVCHMPLYVQWRTLS